MFLLNITVNIENGVREEWLDWMKKIHVPEVLKTGMFVENRIFKLLSEQEGQGGTTYAVQYMAESIGNLMEYRRKYEPALQAAHYEKFKDKYVEFSTILKEEK